MIKECKCGANFKTSKSRLMNGRGKFCGRKCMYKFRKVRPAGLKYKKHKVNPTSFKKGNKPWNAGTKGKVKPNSGSIKPGQRLSPKTEFKLGKASWNKGKELRQIQWEKHPRFKNGRQRMVQHFKRLGVIPICNKCGAEGEYGNRMPIHHKDNNIDNYQLENLEVLCSMCHAHHHKNWRKRWHVT